MIALMLRRNSSISIGDEIKIYNKNNFAIRLAIDAPRELAIIREEPGRVPAGRVLSPEKQSYMARKLKEQGHSDQKIAYVMRIDEDKVRELLG